MEYPVSVEFVLVNSDNTKIKIKGTTEMPFSRLCTKLFQQSEGKIDQLNSIIQFKYENIQLNPESNDTLQTLGLSKNPTIEVSWMPKTSPDKEQMIIDSKKRQGNMRKNKKLQQNQEQKKEINEEDDDPIDNTLKDMAILASEIKTKIFEDSAKGKYISTEEALQKYNSDDQLFSLGLLAKYLEILGIETAIEKENSQTEQKNLDFANILLQFLVNGMINYRKYHLKFKLDKEKRTIIVKNLDEKKKLNRHFKSIFVEKFKISNPKDVIVVSFSESFNIVILLIIKINNFVLLKNDLINIFKDDNYLNDLQFFSEEPVLDAIILSKNMLAIRGNQVIFPEGEKRGGNDYLPPKGWIRYGVRVKDIYDNGNNDWLSWEPEKFGQWSICYHGISILPDDSFDYENENDYKHPGKKIGKGILCYQDPEDMENNIEFIIIPNGQMWKLGFMLRVEPNSIRAKESKNTFWFLNGTPDELRPYGILIKECS